MFSSMFSPSVPLRVNSLDSAHLDSELSTLLLSQFRSIFKYFNPNFLFFYSPEIEFFLNFSIFSLSIGRSVPSPGQALQNFQYKFHENPAINRFQRFGLFFLTIGARWFWIRLSSFMTNGGYGGLDNSDPRRKFYNFIRKCEKIIQAIEIGNFCLFLCRKSQRNIAERILGIQHEFINSRVDRQISFEFLNQQIAWNACSEFAESIGSLIEWQKIRNQIEKIILLIAPKEKKKNLLNNNNNSNNSNEEEEENQKFHCPACGDLIHGILYMADCGCYYDYYCIASRILACSKNSITTTNYTPFRCFQCRKLIRNTKPGKPKLMLKK